MKNFVIFFFFLFFSSNSSTENIKAQGAYLKIIDKVSTKIFNLTLPLGQTFNLGDSEMVIYQCLFIDRKKRNDSIALIRFNSKANEDKNFIGWIIKSSPSLNSLEDPVFEVKLENCLIKDPLFPELIEIN